MLKKFLVLTEIGLKDLINVASKAERWKEVHPWGRIENLLSLYWLAQGGFSKRCCPIAELWVVT